MTSYFEASNEVVTIAEGLIELYHPHLMDARIGFLFRDEAATSKGKKVYATARKPPGWMTVFNDYDFIIEIAEDTWKDLTVPRRKALIDHELSHCFGYEGKFSVVAHDFEEFNQILERHGLWNWDLMTAEPKFKKAAQIELPLSEAPYVHKGKVDAIPQEVIESAKRLNDMGVTFVKPE